MSLLDRATETPRTAGAITRPTSTAPLGGRYVTSRRLHVTEGTYVTGAADRPTDRGTYVTTSAPAPVSGGRYTFSE